MSVKNSEDTFLSREDIVSRLRLVDREIEQLFENRTREKPTVLYDAAWHLLRASGKRLRSLIMLLTCESVGGTPERVLPMAAAAELIQTASLIHDDIVDEDMIRRNVEATHVVYGPKIAILAGDLLIALAVQLVGNLATPDILRLVGEFGVRLCEGETLDILAGHDQPSTLTRDYYLKMIRDKTASFFAWASRIGAMMGGADQSLQERIAQFGENLGLAFQLKDDALDALRLFEESNEDNTGTCIDRMYIGCSYPLVYALETCSESEREMYVKALKLEQIEPVKSLIRSRGAIEATIRLAEQYASAAKNCILELGLTNEQTLIELADFVVNRHY